MDQFSRDEPSKYLELLSFAMKTQKNLVLKFLHIYIVHKMLFITIFERHTRQKKNTKLEFEMKGCVILPMKLLRIYEFMSKKQLGSC